MTYEEIKKALNDEWINKCVFCLHHIYPDRKAVVEEIAEKSANVDEFIDNYITDERTKYSQAAAEVAKAYRSDRAWYLCREILGDRIFKTMSDAGGVKIGTAGCTFIVPNGYGDGYTRVAVVEDKETWNPDYLKFFTNVEGPEINIYAYDCGNQIIKTISGRYGVYCGNDFVVFEKWN